MIHLEVKAVKNVKIIVLKWYDEQGVISIDTSLFLYNLGDYMVDIGEIMVVCQGIAFRVNGDLTKSRDLDGNRREWIVIIPKSFCNLLPKPMLYRSLG